MKMIKFFKTQTINKGLLGQKKKSKQEINNKFSNISRFSEIGASLLSTSKNQQIIDRPNNRMRE